MAVSILPSIIFGLSCALPAFASNLPFTANFSDTPQPFKIDVDPNFIAATKFKASLTRFVEDIDVPPLIEGPTRQNATTVRNYWVDDYDWFQVQDKLNQKSHHFTTTIHTASPSNFTDPVPLHFVHQVSNRSDAIPLLFVHGWPGSFMEVTNIISGLTNPPNASLPAFHVVAPSLPGFGFSPAPKKPGMGPRQMGHAFQSLMLQLNYPKYVVQGGDWGGIILRYIAADFPDSVPSVLSNFWVIQPNATDFARYEAGTSTPDEAVAIQGFNNFFKGLAGYFYEQQLHPLQVAHLLTDSPVGNAMWIYDLMYHAVDDFWWTPKEIITWSMMYWIQGPYAGARIYRESLLEGSTVVGGFGADFPYINQPIAISEFPADVQYKIPLDWARRIGNVVVRNVHTFGGHFAAFQTPDILLGDIWAFWGNKTLSGLEGIF